eukprot:SAG31_NODE_27843_length_419_cov_0.971875_2_plen_37_part_01
MAVHVAQRQPALAAKVHCRSHEIVVVAAEGSNGCIWH